MKKVFLFPFLTILALIFLYFSFTLAWSSIITERVNKDVAIWETKPDMFDSVLAAQYISRVNTAIKLSSSNSELFALQARLLTTIHSHSSDQVEHNHIYDAYYQAIKLNPSSDKVWARFARFSSAQRDIQTTLFSIEKAIALGRFELESISIVLPLIFKHWDEIKKDSRLTNDFNELIKWVLHSKSQNTFLAIDEAAKHKREDLITKNASEQWMVARYRRVLATQNKGFIDEE